MLVWQPREARRADARYKIGGQTWVRPCQVVEGAIRRDRGRQLSRRTRIALEYAVAIGSALVSSYVILRLGL